MNKILMFTAIAMLNFTLAFAFSDTTNIEEKSQTLLGSSQMSSSGYGGLDIKMSKLDDKSTIFAGGRGGWLIDKTFTLGLAAYGSFPVQDATYKNLADSSLVGSRNVYYGGLYFEYILMPKSLIHFTSNVLVGAAVLNFNSFHRSGMDNNRNDDSKVSSNSPFGVYLVIAPEVSAEMNVTSFMKVGLSLSYRMTKFIDGNDALVIHNPELKDIKMNALAGGLYFHFGSF
jgi:hypothetical protein